jgi:hypothetical protein
MRAVLPVAVVASLARKIVIAMVAAPVIARSVVVAAARMMGGRELARVVRSYLIDVVW